MRAKGGFHFDISERKVLLRIIDIVSVIMLLYFLNLLFNLDYFKLSSDRLLWSIVLAIYLTIFATIFELYDLQKASRFDIVFKNVVLTSFLTVLFYLFTPFYTPELPSKRIQILYFFLAINAALLLWRYTYINFISSPRFYKKVLLIADSDDVIDMIACLQKSDPNYRVAGFLDTQQNNLFFINDTGIPIVGLVDIEKTLNTFMISEIVVGAPFYAGITVEINMELIRLLKMGYVIREYSQVYEELTYRIPVHRVEKDFYRYFPFSRNNKNRLYLLSNKILDLIISSFGLFFATLITPFIFLVNIFWNPGPLVYTQERVGRNGKIFKIYKFRSMVVDAEQGGPQYAERGDMRVTRFGRFLRQSRLDEMPQFLNVLRGDMSVIGPRPERPEFVNKLIEQVPFYEVRHSVRPGVTGWAQIHARYASSQKDTLEKLQYDLYYIKHRSIFLDIIVLIKTLSTVIFFRGQ